MAISSEVLKVAKVANVVLTYWTVSILMVFFNKHLVGGKGTSADQPDVSIFIAWVQCLFSVLFIFFYSNVGAFLSDSVKVCRVQYSLLLAKPVVIVSFLFSFMLSSNNYCLKLVGVAFFQIARSFTLIFTVIFSVTLLNMRASYMVILSCIIVVLGFLIGVDQEQAAGTLSVLGVISGLVSSLFVSLNGIYTKKAMKIDEMDSVKLMLHVNINSVVILFIPVVFSGQMAGVVEVGKLTESKFWFATCASGVLGFLIGWASTRQIDYTSPITHHVSNNTKSILQSLLAVWVYEDYKSALWWLGCFTVLLGAFMYTYVRIKEDGRKEKVIEVTNMPARSIHV